MNFLKIDFVNESNVDKKQLYNTGLLSKELLPLILRITLFMTECFS